MIRCLREASLCWSRAIDGAFLGVAFRALAVCVLELLLPFWFCLLFLLVFAFQVCSFDFDASSLFKFNWAASREKEHGCSAERRCQAISHRRCGCSPLLGNLCLGGEDLFAELFGLSLFCLCLAHGETYCRCEEASGECSSLCTLGSYWTAASVSSYDLPQSRSCCAPLSPEQSLHLSRWSLFGNILFCIGVSFSCNVISHMGSFLQKKVSPNGKLYAVSQSGQWQHCHWEGTLLFLRSQIGWSVDGIGEASSVWCYWC